MRWVRVVAARTRAGVYVPGVEVDREGLVASSAEGLAQAFPDRVRFGFEPGERLCFLGVGVQVEVGFVAVAGERGVSPFAVEVLGAQDVRVVNARAL